MADANNRVIFGNKGGMIVPEEAVTVTIKDQSKVTRFRRHGMIYRMDAWVSRADVAPTKKQKQSFQRRGGR